jgi:hypothetical protein
MVFENRVLRGISGPKRAEVTGDSRRLHSDELQNLYASPNTELIKSRTGWAGHVAYKGQIRNSYKILGAIPTGKRTARKKTRILGK